MPPDESTLWRFLPWGYLLAVLIETPVLLAGLSSRHTLKQRLLAGLLLTACTYPIVVLVLPPLVWAAWGERAYVVVAEIFAPLAEIILFLIWTWPRGEGKTAILPSAVRDAMAILAANLTSFLVGEWLFRGS